MAKIRHRNKEAQYVARCASQDKGSWHPRPCTELFGNTGLFARDCSSTNGWSNKLWSNQNSSHLPEMGIISRQALNQKHVRSPTETTQRKLREISRGDVTPRPGGVLLTVPRFRSVKFPVGGVLGPTGPLVWLLRSWYSAPRKRSI